jgi:hypothetical protein
MREPMRVRGLPFLLVALLAAGFPLAAQDEGKPEEARPDDGPAEPGFDWVLQFQNGDSLHCRLEKLSATHVTVTWQVAPDSPVVLGMNDIADLERANVPDETERRGADLLRLHDGTTLYGRLLSLSAARIEYESLLGKLSLPIGRVMELNRRRGEPPAIGEPRPDETVIVTAGEHVFSGKLREGDGGRLVVAGDGFTAEVDPAKIMSIFFPAPEPEAVSADGEGKPTPGVILRLRDGSTVAGLSPRIEKGVLHFRLASMPQRIPLTEVAGLGFIDLGEFSSRATLQSLLVWATHADAGDELKKTLAIVGEQLPKWTVTIDKSDAFDARFRRVLFGMRTLLIPEMEKWDVTDPASLGKQLQPIAASFLRSGGNIVICGVQQAQTGFLREAGLLDVTAGANADGQPIRVLAGASHIGDGLPDDFRGPNATTTYTLGESLQARALADAGDRAVIVGRRVGRGWVIVLGMDFYATTPAASRALANAIQLR